MEIPVINLMRLQLDGSLQNQKSSKKSVKSTKQAQPKERRAFLTPRVVILAILLIIVNDYWLTQMEVVRYIFPTYAAPFWNAIITLFVLILLNMPVRRIFPRIALARTELLAIYVMVSIGSAVCSHNMMQILVSMMGYPTWFATPENNWHELFGKDLPSWLFVSDRNSLTNLYMGGSSLYLPQNWRPWALPAAAWSGFCFALLFTMLCINSIFRKHWIESEKLTFPIVQLPLEMVNGGETGFWRNPYMRAGFAIAAGITFLNGLNCLFPSIPALPIKRVDMSQYFTTPPWNGIGQFNRAFYMFAIGLAFLMPLDLSFSCWFFFLLHKIELVVSTAAGWNQVSIAGGGFDNTYPCTSSQAFGAYMAVCVLTLWSGRHYLKNVWQTAFTKTKVIDESNEPVKYRTAILGAVAGFLTISLFAYFIGFSPIVIIVFFLVYFALAITVTRIRAQLGFPVHDMHVMGPQNLMLTAVPSESLGPNNLMGFMSFFWFNRTYASHPMPHQLEGFKMGERMKSSAKEMFYVCVIASAVAMPIGFWMILHNYFHYGAGTAKVQNWATGLGQEAVQNLTKWLSNPTPTNTTSLEFVGIGFGFAWFLNWMRMKFIWFPFYPLAYAVANSWGMSQLWLPVLIGSTIKFLLMKFGGRSAYQRFVPFFLGLILGEMVTGGFWTLYGIFGGFRAYEFWP